MIVRINESYSPRAFAVLLALFILGSGTVFAQETFYVSPDGDDANVGTEQAPLASLAGARDKVRQALDGEGDITVIFRGGEYPMRETVVFGLEDSGSEKQKITYKAAEGETPVFTSGMHVPVWDKMPPDDPGYKFVPADARDHVFVAPIPNGLGLFRNLVDRNSDAYLDRAKIEVTDLNVTKNDVHGRSVEGQMYDPIEERKVATFSTSMEGLSNVDTALELRLFPSDFHMNLLPVEKIDGTTLITQVPGTSRLSNSTLNEGPFCWIDNVLEGLDEPGEWVVNPETNRIYFYPRNGTDEIYAASLIEYVRVEGDIDFWGPTDNPVQYITFDGLTFTEGERAVWAEGDSGAQHDWAMLDKANALLRFRGAQNCAVRDCAFTKTGGGGVRLDLHAQNVIVENCRIMYCGMEGLHIGGYGAGKKDVNKNNTIRNNEIAWTSRAKWDSPAVIIWNTGFNTISKNYLHHFGKNGFCIAGPRVRTLIKPGHQYESQTGETVTVDMRDGGMPMHRWDEIPDELEPRVIYDGEARRVAIGDKQLLRDLDTDKLIAPYRYLRGNLIEKNVLAHGCITRFGDGVFYISGTADGEVNKIHDNYTVLTDGDGTMAFRGMYVDGFTGDIDIRRNMVVDCDFNFEVYALYNWYDRGSAIANVIYNTRGEAFLSAREERMKVAGNLVFGPGEDESDPDAAYVDEYKKTYRNLAPGVLPSPDPLPDAEKIRLALKRTVDELGGDIED